MRKVNYYKTFSIICYNQFLQKGSFVLMRYLYFTLLFSFFSFSQANEERYQLGNGLQIGSLPLYIGSYFSLVYEHIDEKDPSLTLDDVAIMVYGEYSHFSYMLELEAEDLYHKVLGGRESREPKEHLHMERFYVDYEFDDHSMLRMGKQNSPIGFWNLNPINVLRDTSSSPTIVEQLFPLLTSGVVFGYTQEEQMRTTINLIAQESEDIEKAIHSDIYNNFDLNRHYGVGITLQENAMSCKVSGGYFRTIADEEYTYLLAAFKYQEDNFKLQGEIGRQFSKERSTIPYIGYLQYSQFFEQKHEAIIRVESYHNRVEDRSDNFIVLGYTYRPLYPIALKGEYQWHTYEQENKLLFSLSVLF